MLLQPLLLLLLSISIVNACCHVAVLSPQNGDVLPVGDIPLSIQVTNVPASNSSSGWQLGFYVNKYVFRQGGIHFGQNKSLEIMLGDVPVGSAKFKVAVIEEEMDETICMSDEITFTVDANNNNNNNNDDDDQRCKYGVQIQSPDAGELVVLDEESSTEILVLVNGYDDDCHPNVGPQEAIAKSSVALWDESTSQKQPQLRLVHSLSFWAEEDGKLYDPVIVVAVVMMTSQNYSATIKLTDPNGQVHEDNVQFMIQIPNPSLTIISPSSGVLVSSTFNLIAKIDDKLFENVQDHHGSIQLYVDDHFAESIQITSPTIQKTLSLEAGAHRLQLSGKLMNEELVLATSVVIVDSPHQHNITRAPVGEFGIRIDIPWPLSVIFVSSDPHHVARAAPILVHHMHLHEKSIPYELILIALTTPQSLRPLFQKYVDFDQAIFTTKPRMLSPSDVMNSLIPSIAGSFALIMKDGWSISAPHHDIPIFPAISIAAEVLQKDSSISQVWLARMSSQVWNSSLAKVSTMSWTSLPEPRPHPYLKICFDNRDKRPNGLPKHPVVLARSRWVRDDSDNANNSGCVARLCLDFDGNCQNNEPANLSNVFAKML